MRARVIPLILLKDGGLVKTIKFDNPKYVGDPINAVRIFNDKEVDELILLHISPNRAKVPIPFKEVGDIASEAFMPMGFGGGVHTLHDVYRILHSGFEKVILNTAIRTDKAFVRAAVREAGSQSIVGSIDVKKNFWGQYEVFTDSGQIRAGSSPVEYARMVEDLGVGEIIVNAIDRDGTFQGYDEKLIAMVADAVQIPVVACGGARGVDDFASAIKCGASAVAAGSYFVFYGKHRAVLINYPSSSQLDSALTI